MSKVQRCSVHNSPVNTKSEAWEIPNLPSATFRPMQRLFACSVYKMRCSRDAVFSRAFYPLIKDMAVFTIKLRISRESLYGYTSQNVAFRGFEVSSARHFCGVWQNLAFIFRISEAPNKLQTLKGYKPTIERK